MSAEGGLKDKREKEEGIMSHGFRKKHTHDLEKSIDEVRWILASCYLNASVLSGYVFQ